MVIYGWDASDYDWARGPMDLVAAQRDGIQFFTHKVTEGTSTIHTNFGEAMRRAASAGIPTLGAYHVVRSPRNPGDEVDFFLSQLDRQFPEWRSWPNFFFQVDLEKWPYDAVPAAEGEDFADIAEVRGGRVALIYASKGQYGDALTGTSHELWNANYPTWRSDLGVCPPEPYRASYANSGGDSGPGWAGYSGRTPKIWQYTDNATIGRQPRCDANAFRGSLDELRALIGGTDMEQTETLKGFKAKQGRSVGDVLADLSNFRDWLYGESSLNPPPAGSRAALLIDAANRPTATLTDTQVTALSDRLTAALIASAANGLTAADHAAVRADLKQALREGVA